MFYFCTLICTGLVVASKSYSIIQEWKDLGLEEPSHQPLLPLPSPLLHSPPFFHSPPHRSSYIQQPSTVVKPHESQLSFTLLFLALPFRPFTSIVMQVTFVTKYLQKGVVWCRHWHVFGEVWDLCIWAWECEIFHIVEVNVFRCSSLFLCNM